MKNSDPRISKPVDPKDGPIILLDMDGVCVNFVKGVCEAVGRDYDTTLAAWPKGEYDICKVLGIPPQHLWRNFVDPKGQNFWIDLEPYPWFEDLYGMLCAGYPKRVFFATSPSWSPSSFSGKIWWLQKRLGKDFQNYIFTPHKTLLARSNVLLIDDNGDHVTAFNYAGGHAMLFPQPWNLAPERDDIMEYCLNSVQAILHADTLEDFLPLKPLSAEMRRFMVDTGEKKEG